MRIHKKHGVLMAGIKGYKIYQKDCTLRVVKNNKVMYIKDSDTKIVMRYVNLGYMPLSEHGNIINEFFDLVEGL